MSNVPNTDTFSLTDVTAVVGGESLTEAFANSVDAYFDSAYKGSKDGLLCFRNYGQSILITNPDFIVLRFTWTAANGTDLDTATEFTTSGITGLDNDPVGWYLGDNTLNILKWGGDNRQSGDETVMIDLSVLRSYSSLNETSRVGLYGNWYEWKGVGNISIELKAYLGGTMSKSGFQWINTGGSLITTLNLQKTVTAFQGDPPFFNTQYTNIGYMTYSKSSAQITLGF